jgi:hypothetical protein
VIEPLPRQEAAFLQHEASTGSGNEASELSLEDRELFASSVTLALKRALEPHRTPLEAIQVRWIGSG